MSSYYQIFRILNQARRDLGVTLSNMYIHFIQQVCSFSISYSDADVLQEIIEQKSDYVISST